MNARVVVAAGIDNELSQDDYQRIKALKEKGYEINYIFYIPRIPAEMTQLESVNQDILRWRKEGHQRLKEDAERLGIPEQQRIFVDEILGERGVKSKSQELKAQAIITHEPKELQSVFDRLFWQDLPILDVQSFAKQAEVQPGLKSSTYQKMAGIKDADRTTEKTPEFRPEEKVAPEETKLTSEQKIEKEPETEEPEPESPKYKRF